MEPINTSFVGVSGSFNGDNSCDFSFRLQFDSIALHNPIISIGTFISIIDEGILEDISDVELEYEVDTLDTKPIVDKLKVIFEIPNDNGIILLGCDVTPSNPPP